MSLEALWRRVAAKIDSQAEVLRIWALFVGAREASAANAADPAEPTPEYRAGGWNALNFAEQQVGAHLDDADVAVEYQALLRIANQRGLPGAADFNAAAPSVVNGAANSTPLAKKVAIYLSLLHALQSDFITGRFVRQLRREVAGRLYGVGVACVILTLLAPAAVLVSCLGGRTASAGCCTVFADNAFTLTLVTSFGALGAFFSLASDFQNKVRVLNFEEVDVLYKLRMIVLRLLFGLIGAVVFYCMIRSQLISGMAFPKLETLKIGALFSGASPDTSTRPAGVDPAVELAKLLVWSFIAGFSERLVPQTLTTTEARASQPAQTPPAASQSNATTKPEGGKS